MSNSIEDKLRKMIEGKKVVLIGPSDYINK